MSHLDIFQNHSYLPVFTRNENDYSNLENFDQNYFEKFKNNIKAFPYEFEIRYLNETEFIDELEIVLDTPVIITADGAERKNRSYHDSFLGVSKSLFGSRFKMKDTKQSQCKIQNSYKQHMFVFALVRSKVFVSNDCLSLI